MRLSVAFAKRSLGGHRRDPADAMRPTHPRTQPLTDAADSAGPLTKLTVKDQNNKKSVLNTTQNHPFWYATAHKWTDARNLEPGHYLRVDDEATSPSPGSPTPPAPERYATSSSTNSTRTLRSPAKRPC